MTTIRDSSATHRLRSPDFADSCVEDSFLAKNLLRSAASDDDDDGAATGRLRAPYACGMQPAGCPCTSTSSEWRMPGLFAVPTRDCPFCWAHINDCQNCGVNANESSHRWSTPGIQITSSAESLTFSSACTQGNDRDDLSSPQAKRRCSSLATDIDAVSSAVPCRSAPDITSHSPRAKRPPRPPPPPTRDRWLTAGVTSLPRPTTIPRAGILPTCLHSHSN